MPAFFHRLPARIYAIVVLALGLASILTFTLLNRSVENAFDMRKMELHALTETAISTLNHLDAKVQSGDMTLEEAQTQGRIELEKLRYGKSGYFYAFTHDHVYVAHPHRPKWVGTNQIAFTDKTGIPIVAEMVKVAIANGAGDVTYYFNKPDSEELEAKLGYVINFPKWGWVVGTGSYVNDIYEQLATLRTTSLISLGIGLVLLTIASIVLMRSITGPLDQLNARMQSMASGNHRDKIPGAESRSEIGDMARTLDQFRQALMRQNEMEEAQHAKEDERNRVVEVLSTSLAELSKGKLTAHITEEFPEGYEQLRQDFNTTLDNLTSTVNQMVDTASSIRNGAMEISQSSDDLSNRTESQAATLEETAAALDELTASVRSAAEGARSVESTMQEARNEAETSGEVVQNAVAAMTEIEQSSTHIAQIISVIDDIAFQTNLLALNAGVEAARAGEAGRGFAVVASEVRALAQRSSDAAMEIKTLISNSSQQVERGVDLVGKAGEALNSIVDQVSHISTLISGIAEGAAEQSTGLGEINTGMTQLDQVTQQNAAMVEEATAASHLMNTDAGKLAELVAHFDTGGTRAANVAPMPTASPAAAPSAHGDWEAPAPAPARAVNREDMWQEF